ncbi:MAG: hypothetical protein ACJ8MO_36370, partial [Bacillus sp. (in: firmicutes)]
EIVLWFEHDLYDQTMLMYLLTELSKKEFRTLSMVTINEFPGIEPFYGLGQLSSQQLEELFYIKKQAISADQINEAITGWRAYTSKNPTDIEKWLASCTQKLPFLKTALQSHLSYFPSKYTGLNEVETLVVDYIDENTCSFAQLFQIISKHRINDGIGDLYFAAMLNELMKGSTPLLESDYPLPNYQNAKPVSQLKLTSYGLRFLKSQRGHLEIDRDWWIGGVYLTEDQWFWDGKVLIQK